MSAQVTEVVHLLWFSIKYVNVLILPALTARFFKLLKVLLDATPSPLLREHQSPSISPTLTAINACKLKARQSVSLVTYPRRVISLSQVSDRIADLVLLYAWTYSLFLTTEIHTTICSSSATIELAFPWRSLCPALYERITSNLSLLNSSTFRLIYLQLPSRPTTLQISRFVLNIIWMADDMDGNSEQFISSLWWRPSKLH